MNLNINTNPAIFYRCCYASGGGLKTEIMLEQENTKEPKDDWRLDKLELEFQSHGEHKGKYAGKIRFQNGDWESFTFKIRPDQAQPYIDLIAEDIVKGAESLGERLIDSLGLRK